MFLSLVMDGYFIVCNDKAQASYALFSENDYYNITLDILWAVHYLVSQATKRRIRIPKN